MEIVDWKVKQKVDIADRDDELVALVSISNLSRLSCMWYF
jgi:hypothetical protein